MLENSSDLEALKKANAAFSSGDYLAAFDVIDSAIELGIVSAELCYKAVLSLARSGATDEALDYFQRFRAQLDDSEDVAALEARLYKDQYKRCTDQTRKQQLGDKARDAYLAVFEKYGGTFSGINAATLCLLTGDNAQAAKLAERVLELCGHVSRFDHWTHVTQAEACLLLGRDDEVQKHLQAALLSDKYDIASQSTTYQQLALICQARGCSLELIATIRPPAVIHYTGQMIHGIGSTPGIDPDDDSLLRRQVAQLLSENNVGFAYGALACGADLIVAEEVLARNAELHIVLPFCQDEFCQTSVTPAGSDSVSRFKHVLTQATSTSQLVDSSVCSRELLYETAALQAMGMANLKATMLGSQTLQVGLWNGVTTDGGAGTHADIRRWKDLGNESVVIDIPQPRRGVAHVDRTNHDEHDTGAKRALKAMIFADVKGFSELDERQLPQFINQWQQQLAALVDNTDDLAFINTWGDAAYLVFDSVSAAAAASLTLADLFSNDQHLGLRVAAHVGPVFVAHDPVLGKTNFFGIDVNKTARMEPCTPVGSVYVTEQFAAMLVMENSSGFTCEYAGEHALPKNFGRFRMYRLRGG